MRRPTRTATNGKLDGSALPTLGFFGLVIIGLILVVVGAEWLLRAPLNCYAFGVEEVIGLSIMFRLRFGT